MSRRAGPCFPPTPAIRPAAMATSPLNAALPVPSTIVPPRITMSCMPTSRMGSRRRGRAETYLRSTNIAGQSGGKLGLVDAASLPCSDTTPISTTREVAKAAPLHKLFSRIDRSSVDGAVASPSDQHADHQQVENVGADADGECGRIISEMVVE